MEENICNRCVKQSVCKNYIKGQNVVGCVEFLSIKRTDYLTDDELLDKIRVEIEEERVHDDWDFGQEIYYNNAIKDVLKIIDKYKAKVRNKE